MDGLKKIIQEKNNRLDTVPAEFATSVEQSQKEIYDEILSLIDELERDGDKIKISKKNLEIVAKINDDLRKVFNESEYIKNVTEFVKEFDTQKKINDKYFNKAFSDYSGSPIADQVLANAKANAVELLVGSPIDTELFIPIKDTLDTAVASGASFKDTLKTIRTIAEGGEGADGRLLGYSKTITKTTFATSDRAYTNVISEELDIEWYLYSGGLIDTSRPFCVERDGQFFHYKEIESWVTNQSGEGNPEPNGEWAGEIDGTDAQTIFILAGGWNCNHSIMPVSLFIVPKTVVQRNIDNGNFVPTEKQLELLAL